MGTSSAHLAPQWSHWNCGCAHLQLGRLTSEWNTRRFVAQILGLSITVFVDRYYTHTIRYVWYGNLLKGLSKPPSEWKPGTISYFTQPPKVFTLDGSMQTKKIHFFKLWFLFAPFLSKMYCLFSNAKFSLHAEMKSHWQLCRKVIIRNENTHIADREDVFPFLLSILLLHTCKPTDQSVQENPVNYLWNSTKKITKTGNSSTSFSTSVDTGSKDSHATQGTLHSPEAGPGC